jgi:hypothetical protein
MQKIIDRVKEIVLKPKDTWVTIKAEEDTIAGLCKDYLFILAAVPALASFLGNWIVGYRLPFRFGPVIRLSFIESLVVAIIWYATTIAGIWIIAKAVSFLAPRFGSAQDDIKGFKIAVYSYTPYLAAGLLYIIPSVGNLAPLLGLYGFYLLYIGLPVVMDTPKEKSLAYTITIGISIILIFIIVMTITVAISGAFSPSIYVGG